MAILPVLPASLFPYSRLRGELGAHALLIETVLGVGCRFGDRGSPLGAA